MVKKKGVKISAIKRSNQKKNKLTKQGKVKARRHKKDPKPKNVQPKQVEDDGEENLHGEDMIDMMEADDLAHLKNVISQRSYDLLKKIRSSEDNGPRKRRTKHEDDDLEQQYENKSSADAEIAATKRTRYMLPIKTSKGVVTRTIEEDGKEGTGDEDEKLTLEDGEEEEEAATDNSDAEIEEQYNPQEKCLDTANPVTFAQLLACRQEVLNQRKFRIGVLSSGLLENPEGKIKNFKPLLDMMEENNPEVKLTVRKLATISLLEVFKDILPSYYIKILNQENIVLKKSTLELRRYEQDLLKAYRNYLTQLEKFAAVLMRKKGDSRKYAPEELGLGELAVHCMSDLLVAHPYFNYSVNMAQLLVIFLDNHSQSVRETALKCIQQVIKGDKRGELSLEIVRRVNALVKKREHNVHCEVLQCLLALRIKDVNLDKEKEDDIQHKKLKGRKMKLLTMSRSERKREKKLKEVESELQETKAEENKQRKQQHLTEITKIVFMIYFRVLKQEPNPKLLSVTLEGLAKFSHCINLDFYHDLVNVLDQLMASGDLGHREQLHIVQTVFTILSGHGEMLTIDPCRFYTHLYRNLLSIHAGQSHQDMLILIRALETMLIQRRKKISQQRLLAFTKRLSTLSLQVLHNGSLACLSHIKSVLQLNKSADVLLDLDNSGGQGVFNPMLDEPEYCSAANSALWELALLQHHYHPTVRKFAKVVASGAPVAGPGSLSLDLTKLNAEELFRDYDGSTVAFRPAVIPPRKSEPKARPSKNHLHNESLANYIKDIMDKPAEDMNFSKALLNPI